MAAAANVLKFPRDYCDGKSKRDDDCGREGEGGERRRRSSLIRRLRMFMSSFSFFSENIAEIFLLEHICSSYLESFAQTHTVIAVTKTCS